MAAGPLSAPGQLAPAEVCEIYDSGFGECGAEAEYRVVTGCVHEHVDAGPVCADHTGWLNANGPVYCGACASGPDGHDCQLGVVEIKSLAATETQ